MLTLTILLSACWGLGTLIEFLNSNGWVSSACLLTNGFIGSCICCSTSRSCLTRFGAMALVRSCTCPVKTCGLVNFCGCPFLPGAMFEYGRSEDPELDVTSACL